MAGPNSDTSTQSDDYRGLKGGRGTGQKGLGGPSEGRTGNAALASPARGAEANVWAYHLGDFNPGAGWTHAFQIMNLTDLLDKLREAKLQSRILKLVVLAHGDNGGVVQLDPEINYKNVQSFAKKFQELGDFLISGGKLIFMSCQAGAGKEGTEFLGAISRLLPGRTVIGFIVKGSLRARGMAGDVWEAPRGMTGVNPAPFKDEPRMTEESIYAKWLRDGRPLRLPAWDELATLRGNWTVTSATADGRSAPDLGNAAVVFRLDSIEVTRKGVRVWSASYRVDLLKRPRTIDLTYTAGKQKGKSVLGILRFGEGYDTLLLCLAEPAIDRPDDFTANPKSRRILLELQRAPA
jgi:uncharacterized protein (TIGR03067 family)